MSDPASTNIGGAKGLMFTMTNIPVTDPEIEAPYPDRFGINHGAGEEVTVHIVDVQGQTVVIAHVFAKTWPERFISPMTEEEYAEAKAAAQALIDTITWRDLN